MFLKPVSFLSQTIEIPVFKSMESMESTERAGKHAGRFGIPFKMKRVPPVSRESVFEWR